MGTRRIIEQDARLTAVLEQVGEREGAVLPTVEAVEDAWRLMADRRTVSTRGEAMTYYVEDGEVTELVAIFGTSEVVLWAECSCHSFSVCAHMLVALAHHGVDLRL